MLVNFSVVLICRNEAKTLPRLLKSLVEFQKRDGEIILLDTGSTDNTPDIARSLGCKVTEVGERFLTIIDEYLAEKINTRFVIDNEAPIVTVGDKLFDYSSARNFAATLSSNDMCAMPDCDEAYTVLNLDAIQKAIKDGGEQLEYHFVFSHYPDGAPAIQFMHCKFYDRRKLHWEGIVHEVLQGSANRVYLDTSIIKLEHWQEPSEHRSRYLTGLALDCYLHQENDRNSHYFGRELVWNGRYRSGIKELERHVEMHKFPMERAQSMVFIGDAYEMLGDEQNALKWYNQSFLDDGTRREPLLRMATHFWKKNDALKVACYCAAVLEIGETSFYANYAAHYTYEPHELMYWAQWYLGNKEESKKHWEKAIGYTPLSPKYLHDARFYLDLPKVSIIIPTLGREEKLQRCVDAIKKNANYPEELIEIIVERDSFEDRQGVPKTLKAGVAKSTGELVMFLGNDCIPEENFLILAVMRMLKEFPRCGGLIGLNDGPTNQTVAKHWLASKNLLKHLDGEFFCTLYHHVGCDNELTGRCLKMNKYVYCDEAKIKHDHFVDGAEFDDVYKLGWNEKCVVEDRKLLQLRSKTFGFEII
jgi:glycosyltransferase involved in cell wall biosynthesis